VSSSNSSTWREVHPEQRLQQHTHTRTHARLDTTIQLALKCSRCTSLVTGYPATLDSSQPLTQVFCIGCATDCGLHNIAAGKPVLMLTPNPHRRRPQGDRLPEARSHDHQAFDTVNTGMLPSQPGISGNSKCRQNCETSLTVLPSCNTTMHVIVVCSCAPVLQHHNACDCAAAYAQHRDQSAVAHNPDSCQDQIRTASAADVTASWQHRWHVAPAHDASMSSTGELKDIHTVGRINQPSTPQLPGHQD